MLCRVVVNVQLYCDANDPLVHVCNDAVGGACCARLCTEATGALQVAMTADIHGRWISGEGEGCGARTEWFRSGWFGCTREVEAQIDGCGIAGRGEG